MPVHPGRTQGGAIRGVPTADAVGLLKALCGATDGGSGLEAPVAGTLRGVWAGVADEVGGDGIGNLWAVRRGGGGPPVLLAAHLDVISLIVTRRLPGGFLRCAPLGGVDPRTLPGREVVVHGRQSLRAIVATVPPHLTRSASRSRLPAADAVTLDTGFRDEALEGLVRPGDRAHFATEPAELLGGRWTAAGLDNRAGVAALTQALAALSGVTLDGDLVVAANVQEEVGLRGIAPLGERLRPAAAVVVDVGFAQQPGVEEYQGAACGGGPVLALGPSLHPEVHRLLAAEAQRLDIPLQREVLAGPSGTDAWALQVAAGDVPTGLLSIPLRSMHSPSEVVDLADVRRTGLLLAAWARAAGLDWRRGLTRRLAGGATQP